MHAALSKNILKCTILARSKLAEWIQHCWEFVCSCCLLCYIDVAGSDTERWVSGLNQQFAKLPYT